MEYNPGLVPYTKRPPDPDRDPLEVLTRRRAEVRDAKELVKFYFAWMVLFALAAWYLPTEILERILGEHIIVLLYRACIILSISCGLLFWYQIKTIPEQPQLLDFNLTREQRKLLGLNPDAKAEPGALDCRPKRPEIDIKIRTPEDHTQDQDPRMAAFMSSLPPHDYSALPETLRTACTVCSLPGGFALPRPPTLKPEKRNASKYADARLDILWKMCCENATAEPFDAANDISDMLDQKFRYSGVGWINQPGETLHFVPPHEYRVAQPPYDSKKNMLRNFAIVDGLPVLSEWQLLANENIANGELFEWSDRVREWLADYLLKPIAAMIEQIDEELRLNGLGHLSTTNCVNTSQSSLRNAFQHVMDARRVNPNEGYVAPTPDKAATFFKGPATLGGPPATLEDFMKRFPKWVVAVDRLRLEVYLNVPGYEGAREYILKRIKTLAGSYMLQHYKHDGGSSDWTYKKYPSDPEILCHIFCSVLDLNMPISNPADLPFSKNYFVPTDGQARPQKGVQIKQTRKAKHGGVHYMLITKRVCYDLRPGMHNLFLTITSFVWHINKYYNGYIGALNMNGKTMNLKSVFEQRLMGTPGGRCGVFGLSSGRVGRMPCLAESRVM